MRFRILGPLEVATAASEQLPVSAPRQQVVLAMLLLKANRTVSIERLIDAVWDESPPPTARGQIQICVSALRQLLSHAGHSGGIVTRPPGYLFRIADGQLDLQVFEGLEAAGRRAAKAGRLAEAAAAFGEALALWRGEPLSGVNSRLVESAATRLTERWLSAVEEHMDAQLRLGAHHQLISELMELVEANPLRERLRVLLMLALHRAGRRAEALEAYWAARETLVEELGLEPGEELRRLQHVILAGDLGEELRPLASRVEATTTGAEIVPRLLPADIPEFTGRAKLVAQLQHLLATRASSEYGTSGMNVAAISGNGGVGKSKLAIHVAHELRDTFPDGQLYAELDGSIGRSTPPSQALERFLRALGVSDAVMPEGTEERAEMYRSRIADRRILIVLDDAADEEQVRPLLPSSSSCTVVVTSRPRLTGLAGASHVEVGVLDSDDAAELLAAVLGPERTYAEPDGVLHLVQLCSGLPLALRIAAARLAARPHWTVAQFAERLEDKPRCLDHLVHGALSVRDSIGLTYQRLAPRAQRLFRRLGMLETQEFPGWVSGPLLGEDVAAAEEVLESLADVHLVDVECTPGRPPMFHFNHLIQAYALERLAAEEPPEEPIGALRRVLGAWLFLAEESRRRGHGGDRHVAHSDTARWPLPAELVDRLLIDPRIWNASEHSAVLAAMSQAVSALARYEDLLTAMRALGDSVSRALANGSIPQSPRLAPSDDLDMRRRRT
jgi:DNA-binding SARP family transcriptional activator